MHAFEDKYFLNTVVVPFIWITTLYSAIYFLNNWLTGFLYLVPGAHLVHLPTGFKLLFVLISGWIGALSIGFVAFIYGFFFMFKGDLPLDLELAVIGALTPYLTYLFFKNKFEIQSDLLWLTQKRVLVMGLMYASLNSALLQMVLFWNGITTDFLNGLLVMFIGDLTGLYCLFLLIKPVSKLFNIKPPSVQADKPTTKPAAKVIDS